MADIFCNNCGLVFDSRVLPCPRCRRCSRCGTRCPKGVERCPRFEHASDADALAELERNLDPSLSANQKTIRWCQRAWENSRLIERLSIWGHLAAALLITICMHVLSELLLTVGIHNLWIRVLVCTLAMFASWLAFLHLLRRGWLRWLLHDGASSQASDSEG